MKTTIHKAVYAAAFAWVGAFATVLSDGNVTGPETLAAISTGLAAGYATYRVRNRPKM